MSIFDKFKNGIDQEAINKGIEEAKERGGGFKEVPEGTYEVSVDKMEIGETKTGKERVSIWFTILDGDFKGSKLFYNQTLSEDWHLFKALEFIQSMGSEAQPSAKIKNMDDLQTYLDDVFEDIDEKGLEYDVAYKINKSGFGNVEKIVEVLY